jgi:hypothetical protein
VRQRWVGGKRKERKTCNENVDDGHQSENQRGDQIGSQSLSVQQCIHRSTERQRNEKVHFHHILGARINTTTTTTTTKEKKKLTVRAPSPAIPSSWKLNWWVAESSTERANERWVFIFESRQIKYLKSMFRDPLSGSKHQRCDGGLD